VYYTTSAISLSPSSSATSIKLPFRRHFTVVARPPRHLPHLGIIVLPSPPSTHAGELVSPGAAGSHAPVSAPPCPGGPVSAPPPVHGGPSTRPWFTTRGSPRGFFLQKNILYSRFFRNLIERSLEFSVISPRSKNFS
jgi:hypothetical protein